MAAVPPQGNPAVSNMAALTQAHALHRQGRLKDAEVMYREILAAQPDLVDALHLLALIETQNHRHEAALALFDTALRLRPDLVSAWVNRGVALQGLKRDQDAMMSYGRALVLQPAHLKALLNRAVLLQDRKLHADALAGFDAVLRVSPQHAEALYRRATVLQALRRSAEALEASERCLALSPDRLEVLAQHAMALMRLGRVDEALVSYDRAVQIDPDHVETLRSRAFALQQVGRHAEARENYARARTLQPGYARAQQDDALCALLLGDFAAGWPQFEWRFRQKRRVAVDRELGAPRWDGTQDLQGRTILLHAEQGLGDTIQFCRYAKAVSARGATVVLQVQSPLRNLLAEVEGADAVVVLGDTLPAFDLQCPLMSLPLAFGTDLSNIPAPMNLRAPKPQVETWERRLGDDARLRVGLVWSGSPFHVNDRNRSISLADIGRIVVEGARFCALQPELREADRDALRANPQICLYGAELRDFSDTAALIEAMDLVITVDTSVAHLAGTMGKPTWILLPAYPDWRWMLDREDSPWYPTARLFRQPAAGDWASVIDRVRDALADWVERRAD